ncbi:putative protein of unknown function (DUF4496) [Blattamonas nauphoetae]|uniref:CCDC81 HU domain-containing protein n=1 Tax=Blattamonas nauphoetae TaxID=2049346 RepID=A0ABQ9X7H4_9EUKA|nr:putative protein of unknown function (DUF4496) [Blattamonas nauphoetae]
MSLSKSDIAAEAALIKGAPSADQIEAVIDGCSEFLESNLQNGKGVNFPDFGVFTFKLEHLNVGLRGTLADRTPIFHLAQSFARSHGIIARSGVQDTSNIPVVLLNFSAIGQFAGLSRDETNYAYKLFLIAMGNAIHRQLPLNIDLKIANFIVRPGSSAGQMKFKRGVGLELNETVPPTTTMRAYQSTLQPKTAEAQMRHTLNRTRGIQTPPKPNSRDRPRATVKHTGAYKYVPTTYSSFVEEDGTPKGAKEYKNPYDWPRKQHLTEEDKKDMKYRDMDTLKAKAIETLHRDYYQKQQERKERSMKTRGGYNAPTKSTLSSTWGGKSGNRNNAEDSPADLRQSYGGKDRVELPKLAGSSAPQYGSAPGYRQSQQNPEMSPPATRIPQSSVKPQTPQTQRLTPTVNTRGAGDTMGSTGGSIWDGTATFNSKGSVFSQLKDFPGAKNIKADPSLPSTTCRVCGRFSRYLPAPNMCSMCISRATQVVEKERQRQLEQEEKLKFQKFAEDNDKYDLEDAKTEGVMQKTVRREIDADNSRKINETMKTRSMTKDDPVINGITDNGDVFYSRPEPIPDPERKRIYREALQKQMGETRALRKKEEDEELEYGARAREYEIEEKKRQDGKDYELKMEKQNEAKEGYENQIRNRPKPIPAQYGYQPEGDPFTINDADDAEEKAERNKHTLNQQLMQIREKRAKREREQAEELERDRAAFAGQKEQQDKDIRELLEKDEEMKQRQRAVLRKQMANKKKDEPFVGYDKNGDPFTQGESAEEVRQRQLENQRKMAIEYRKQLDKEKARKDEEREQELKEGREQMERDRQEVEADRQKEQEHLEYTRTYTKALEGQIEEQRTRTWARNHDMLNDDPMYLSPQIGEAPDERDCERPYYAKRKLTKADRLQFGF